MKCRIFGRPTSIDEWLAYRRKGITGTDIGALLGVSPFKSAFGVYADKIYGDRIDETEAMRLGNFMEEPIVRYWQQQHKGRKIKKVNAVLQHASTDIALGDIDRLIMKPQEVLEAKLVGGYKLGDWEDGKVPPHYEAQVMWYLYVTGLDVAHFAALIGGTQFVERTVERNDKIIEAMVEVADNFWRNHIEKNQAPALDGMDKTSDMLQRLFNKPQKVIVDIPDAAPWITQYEQAKEEEKEAKRKKQEAQNNIQYSLKDAESGVCNNYQLNWKSVTSNRVDTKMLKEKFPQVYQAVVKEQTSRRFTLKEDK